MSLPASDTRGGLDRQGERWAHKLDVVNQTALVCGPFFRGPFFVAYHDLVGFTG